MILLWCGRLMRHVPPIGDRQPPSIEPDWLINKPIIGPVQCEPGLRSWHVSLGACTRIQHRWSHKLRANLRTNSTLTMRVCWIFRSAHGYFRPRFPESPEKPWIFWNNRASGYEESQIESALFPNLSLLTSFLNNPLENNACHPTRTNLVACTKKELVYCFLFTQNGS